MKGFVPPPARAAKRHCSVEKFSILFKRKNGARKIKKRKENFPGRLRAKRGWRNFASARGQKIPPLEPFHYLPAHFLANARY